MNNHKNKKKKIGAVKKTAPNIKNKKSNNSFDDEYFIGMPRKNEDYSNIKKKKVIKNKKVKKLSAIQIKRRKIFLKIVKWTTILAILIGGFIYVMLSPIFSIKKITVSTDGKLNEQEIISLSAIKLNENMFKYTKSQITENIKENSYVEAVKIKRKLPDEIKIEIKERTPKLMITYGNAYVYISNQGYMLEISQEYQNLTILKGIETQDEEIEIGKRLCNEDLKKLNTVFKIIEIGETEGIKDLITAIDIEDESDYKLIMDSEEKIVYLGNCSSLYERILWIKKFLESEKGIPGEIIVNMNKKKKKNPFFRERV